jgi:hypothetical protein
MSASNVVQFSGRLLKTRSEPRPTEEEIRGVLYKCWAQDGIWYRIDFAHRLRLLRKALQFSEQEAADALCVTLRTYRRYERAQPTRPNHPGIQDFAERFGVSINWLLAGEGRVLMR